MKRITDIIWKKFWRLIVINEWETVKWRRKFICRCGCWNTKLIHYSALQQWLTQSCWCLHNERFNHFTHWLRKSKLYSRWNMINQRCNNKNNKAYKNYGWRWIKNEWNSFIDFYNDMTPTYIEWLTIDRMNNNWNYCKENCRWATYKEQNLNRRQFTYYFTKKDVWPTAI